MKPASRARAGYGSLGSAVRPLAALAMAAVAAETLFSAATPNRHTREHLIEMFAPRALPSVAHLLALVGGLMMLVVVPSLWRGTRRALDLSMLLLVTIAALNLAKGLDYDEALLDLALLGLLILGRQAFVLGCATRPRLIAAIAAVSVWALVYSVLLIGLLVSDRGDTVADAATEALSLGGIGALGRPWSGIVELLLVVALVVSAWVLREVLGPVAAVEGHSADEYAKARGLVMEYGTDSLARFILREDKAFHFHGGAVLAYRVLAGTAVISSDPVGPDGAVAQILEDFMGLARRRGWHVVLSGASERHLARYRALGLRHLHIGNEAYVDPNDFSLEGRSMRKVRQSVHRIQRRGWSIEPVAGEAIGGGLAVEIAALDASWRRQQRRIIGFAMGMGPWEAERAPGDLYVLGRDAQGALRGVLRFVAHPGGLSLDTMRRVGECPNGLNEALMVGALEVARQRGVEEVSLNFAGFAHLMAAEAAQLQGHRRLARFMLRVVGRRFQMERLVRFNDKFRPAWRSRFLVYDSRTRLPLLGLRVLQAEAYLRSPRRRRAIRHDERGRSRARRPAESPVPH